MPKDKERTDMPPATYLTRPTFFPEFDAGDIRIVFDPPTAGRSPSDTGAVAGESALVDTTPKALNTVPGTSRDVEEASVSQAPNQFRAQGKAPRVIPDRLCLPLQLTTDHLARTGGAITPTPTCSSQSTPTPTSSSQSTPSHSRSPFPHQSSTPLRCHSPGLVASRSPSPSRPVFDVSAFAFHHDPCLVTDAPAVPTAMTPATTPAKKGKETPHSRLKEDTTLVGAVVRGEVDDMQRMVDDLRLESPVDEVKLQRELNNSLYMAVTQPNLEMAGAVIDLGAEIEPENFSSSESSVHMGMLALEKGWLDAVKLFLQKGAKFQFTRHHGSALHAAASTGSLEMLELMLAQHIDINMQNVRAKQTPLHVAIANKHVECALRLLDAGADGSIEDGVGKTALHVAAQHGTQELCQRLINQGVDPRAVDSVQATAWTYSMTYNQPTIDDLLREFIEVKRRYSHGRTPLHVAARDASVTCMERLVDLGADVEAVDDDGETALMYACRKKSITFLERYVKHTHGKCGVNIRNKSGEVPLHVVIEDKEEYQRLYLNSWDKFVKSLLDMGGDLNVPLPCGQTMLIASLSDDKILTPSFKFLLGLGADINVQPQKGLTCLWTVCAMRQHRYQCTALKKLLNLNFDLRLSGLSYSVTDTTPMVEAFMYHRNTVYPVMRLLYIYGCSARGLAAHLDAKGFSRDGALTLVLRSPPLTELCRAVLLGMQGQTDRVMDRFKHLNLPTSVQEFLNPKQFSSVRSRIWQDIKGLDDTDYVPSDLSD